MYVVTYLLGKVKKKMLLVLLSFLISMEQNVLKHSALLLGDLQDFSN